MARTDHGNKLRTLTLQKGSRFVQTRSGLDSGARTWLIDRAFTLKNLPRPGMVDFTYRGMFLDSVEVTELENNVDQIVGNFLGILNPLNPKPDLFEDSSDSEYTSQVPAEAIQPITFHTPRPRITHTYLSKEKPSILDVGKNIVPFGYPATFTPGKAYTGITIDAPTVYFSGWILASRTTRSAGLSGAGSIYETVDVYTYEYLTSANA